MGSKKIIFQSFLISKIKKQSFNSFLFDFRWENASERAELSIGNWICRRLCKCVGWFADNHDNTNVSSVCGALRFSKLKLIKTYLRSTLSQERLNNLTILSIENDISSSLDYDALIKTFSAAKARKVHC